MKNKIHIVIIAIPLIFLLGVIVVGVVGAVHRKSLTKCTALDVCVSDSAYNKFLTSGDVRKIVHRDFGGIVNRPAGDIDLNSLERLVLKQGFIEEAQAYLTPDGTLHLDVRQCTPVIKLTSEGMDYYLDGQGKCFRIKNDWRGDILAVKGHPPVNDTEWRGQMASFAMWLEDNAWWKERVSQISCDGKGELVIRLKERNETFEIGMPHDTEIKFHRIRIYEDNAEAFRENGKKYKTVSVKYKGQIICK